MNCRDFRKYVGAFADGELDTQVNAGILEHLNMCPDCARRVNEVHRMKEAIRRLYEAETAPDPLVRNIRKMIRETDHGVARPGGSWLHRLIIPTSMAAAIAAAVLVWQFSSGPAPPPGSKTIKATFATEDVRHQHERCCDHPVKHDETLGRDLEVIARNLGRKLNLRAIAPDLTKKGYNFTSAHICSIRGRRCGHLIYHDSQGRIVSVFSIVTADCSDMKFGDATDDGKPSDFVRRVGNPPMIAWACASRCTAYIVCGAGSTEELHQLARFIQRDRR
jgi:hypothetical protein